MSSTGSAITGQIEAVLDGVADGVTVQDAEGRLVYANAAAVALIGFESRDELLTASTSDILGRFELFDETGEALPLADLPGRRALAGETSPEATLRFRVIASGEERWAHVSAVAVPDGRGSRFAINTFHDITEQIRIEEELRASERRYRGLVEAMPHIAWATDPDGRLELVNERWVEYTGEAHRIGSTIDADARIHPEDRERLRQAWAEARSTGRVFEAECRLKRADGVYRWHLLRAVAQADEAGAVRAWIGTSTDIDVAKLAEQRLRLLARAGVALEQTLDPAETIQVAASVAVPDLADWCIIDLLEPDGSTVRAGVAYADEWLRERVEQLRPFPTDLGRPGAGSVAIQTGRPVLVSDLTAEDLGRIARSPEHASLLAELDPRSLITMPLTARGQTLGVMILAAGPSGRRYETADVELAQDVAGRVALAISNAQLYAAEQRARGAAEAAVARTDRLQRAAAALAGAFTRGEVVEIVLRDSVPGLSASGGVIALRTEDGEALEVHASRGLRPEVVERWSRFPVSARIPLADAVRTGRPVWLPAITDAEVDDPRLRRDVDDSPNASLCAVPILIEGRAVGALGLTFADPRPFDDDDRSYIAAYADLCGQALDRVALSEAREALLSSLQDQRARLETVLRQMPSGVIIAEAPSGRILLTNPATDRIWHGRLPRAESLEQYEQYAAVHPDGRRYRPAEWPLARALLSGVTVTDEELEIIRLDGSTGWVLVDAAPIRDRDGQIVAGVATLTDITERRLARENERFLAEASDLLGRSLDYEEALQGIADLAGGRITDWFLVDLIEDGEIRRIATGHPGRAPAGQGAELGSSLSAMLDHPGGIADVIRTGTSSLVQDVPEAVAAADAGNAEHSGALSDLGIRSFLSVPLAIGSQVVGALTFVGVDSGRRFGPGDVVFAENLAARTAAAIQRARLFRDVSRYKRIVDATLDAVFLVDPQTLRYTYVNDGAADQLGHPREALLSMGPADVIADLDTEAVRRLVAPLLDGTLESRTVTVQHRHRNGRLVPVDVLLQRVRLPGEPDTVVAIARDISERVDAQERLQRLAEAEHARAAELNAVIRAIGDGIIVCDRSGRVILCNPAARELFGPTAGTTYSEVLRGVEGADEAPALGARGGPVELKLRGEEERWVEVSTFPVDVAASTEPPPAERGEPGEAIVMFRDVTVARQRQAVRDTFLGVLSHELRTPITTIFAASKVLGRTESSLTDDLRREIFEDVRIEAERLHRLVEDVIALQRFGDEEGEVGNEPVLLQRLLPGVIRSEVARWGGVEFELDLPAGLPAVIADPTYVEQVVRNLLSNAAKYGGAGTHVLVTAREAGEEVTVRILDDGPGFPAEHADRLFDLYFRSPSTAGTASGAGIGLFVCARLIAAMGGRIWSTPREPKGAEFGFSLRIMGED